ncbi:hypothetical protein TNCT6_40090 [Streptomyces sp. 6-11-2]|nr:hypothetical protein TNCT6_40090 [Streptomyces sp. 6-11-2]
MRASTPRPLRPRAGGPDNPPRGGGRPHSAGPRNPHAVLSGARAADTPTCVYVETETADTVSGASWARAWWDVPVAGTATRPSPVTAHELNERHVSTRRRHL